MKLSDDSWTCLDEEVGVWSRTYQFTKGAWSNCFVVRIAKGKLAIISPPCGLSPADYDGLDAHGEIVAILAPNGFHHLGLPVCMQRYPDARVYAHAKTAKRVMKKQASITSFEPTEALGTILPAHVKIFDPPHMKSPDMMAHVKTDKGYIWYSNDVLGNTPELPPNPILKALFKWTRSGPGYSVNRFVLKFLGPQAGFADWMRSEVDAHPPRMVVPGHGHVVHEGDVHARTCQVLDAGL